MDSINLERLITENMKSIFGFALTRLGDVNEAEYLASDILYEIMRSAKNLKDEARFYGFMWKIAENTYADYLRKKSKIANRTTELDENIADQSVSVLDIVIKKENLNLLQRELSLLSKQYRDTTVLYYIENLSCSKIAQKLNISTEMVKYYLFRARKIIREGISMERLYGEKSYNPGTFRLNFWGDRNHYGELFKRKLPGSIALAAYYTPLSTQELSLELGVATPYLEDELELLEAAGILIKNGSKYQTNLVIITDEYEAEFQKKTKDFYPTPANAIWQRATKALKEVRKLNFQGNDYDDNRLLFAILNIAMVRGYSLAQDKSPIGNAPKLPLGSYGWIWGHDNDCKNSHFLGVCMEAWNKENSAWFSAENYRIIEKVQRFEHTQFTDKIESMCDAVLERTPNNDNKTLPWLIENNFIILDGEHLKANFPVFNTDSYNKVCEIINSMAEIVADCMITISNEGADILSEHAPKSVKNQCTTIAKIHHRLTVAAILMENLIESKCLSIPDKKIPLCVWGVRK